MWAWSASTPDENHVPGVLLLLLALVTLDQLVAVELHGGKLEWVARELPAVFEQRLGTEESFLPSTEFDEAILAVDHADNHSGAVRDHLDVAALPGDTGQMRGVLLVDELSFHSLPGEISLNEHRRRIAGAGQAKCSVEWFRGLRIRN